MVACRKPLAPNIDRNKAPETWITAAPFDTITLVKGDRPRIGTIPVRFHVYWAGSDRDGSVVGYYWAVVETLPLPPPGSTVRPPLPGPRADDYRYTTRTDSTFIFSVAEDIPDRQHAFYIYAVDDKGRPDPTPARFIFNAQDQYPPVPVFDEAFATGKIYFFDAGILRSETRTFPIQDSVRFSATAPRDTVPAGSRITFRFHGEVSIPGSVIKGFRYKLDEPELQPIDPDSLLAPEPAGNVIEYGVPADQADPARNGADIQRVATGTKVFLLRAVDQAEGSRDAYRRLQYNFSPDTWLAGPDPDVTGGPWRTNEKGEKYALLVNGRPPAGGLPGTLLSPDSVQILPVNRVRRRTFLEIYKDTVFIRGELGTPAGQVLGSTVHLGAWVLVHNGGFDRDSPYAVKVADGIKDLDPSFPDGPVLRADEQNGCPIGFRSIIVSYLTPNGQASLTSLSRLYPYYDPNDVLNFQRIGAYHPMTRSGRAYSLQLAEDGDGARDGRVENPRQVVESPSSPEEAALRPLVLVFDVNFPPVLKTGDPTFRPRVAVVDTVRAPFWNLELPAGDIDPFASGAPGGPSAGGSTLRLRFKITGKDSTGAPLEHYDPPPNMPQQAYVGVGTTVNLRTPANLATGPATLTIELCDCAFCEDRPGEGRCITRDIQVYHVALPPTAATATPSRPGLD